jgi:hypothetical protein
MSIIHVIECDGCGHQDAPTGAGPVRLARAWFRARGWLVAQTGGKDYCPDCRGLARKG